MEAEDASQSVQNKNEMQGAQTGIDVANMDKSAKKYQDTYAFIDVSNIRSACAKTLGFRLDFIRLLHYLQHKYPGLIEARYYEGILKDDEKKAQSFDFLEEKGYKVCRLERKAYSYLEKDEREVTCPECGHTWTAEFEREHKVMKSNVDVFMASDMLMRASKAERPTRLIVVSCDGDFAEAIRSAILMNDNVTVRVMATPSVRGSSKNALSLRLKRLYREVPEHRYELVDMATIKQYIERRKKWIEKGHKDEGWKNLG